jgi:SAM-dependent methyltransferase
MKKEEVSKIFWKSTKFYPNYPFLKERRKYEIEYLLKNIPSNSKSLLDLGCGNGSTTILLRELTYIETYFCFDISENMLSAIGPNRDSRLIKKVWDANDKDFEFPNVDVTISMNMFPCIFDDEILEEIIKNIKSNIFISRITCEKKRLEINKFSEDLGRNVAACYRTEQEYLSLMKKYFKEVHVSRAFPDDIESKYGSKQMFFLCEK